MGSGINETSDQEGASLRTMNAKSDTTLKKRKWKAPILTNISIFDNTMSLFSPPPSDSFSSPKT